MKTAFYETVACVGKIAHETKAQAIKVMQRRTKKKDMQVYHCQNCRKWHIGSSGMKFT